MAGRYKAYPEYKDSGVEWLDQIPSHWKMVKLSYGLKLQSGDTITSAYIKGNGDFPVYGGNGTRGFTSTYNCDGQHVLIGRQGALCGNINLASGKFFASEHAVVVYPSKYWNTKYIAGMLLFMNLGQYSVSAAQPGVSVERLNMLKVIQPPLPEQKQIARFLDHETAKIDRLIAKQRALIALLKEKRQAVISHAVTKGLPSTSSGQGNPNAKMKNSGVEWLGQVPEHWEVAELKRHCSVQGGYAFNSDNFRDAGNPVIRIGDIDQDGSVNLESAKCVDDATAERYKDFTVKAGEIVMAMTGATIGKAGWFVAEKPCLVNQRVGVYKTNEKILGYRFLWYVLATGGYKEYIRLTAFGGAQPNISDAGMVAYKATLPDLDEQREIADFLDSEVVRFEEIGRSAQSAINLLQERRTALTSAAVTGKIDVRDWEPIADVTDD